MKNGELNSLRGNDLERVNQDRQYKLSGDATLAYDLGDWHAECSAVEFQYPYVLCKDCRVVAHIDLVGAHITHVSSHEGRK